METRTREPKARPSQNMPTHSEFALVLLWSSLEQDRIGELLQVPSAEPPLICSFGRGIIDEEPGRVRLSLIRQRPGKSAWGRPLENPYVSRIQIELTAAPEGLRVSNRGRCALVFRGNAVKELTLRAGQTIEIEDQMLFLCVKRPFTLPPLQNATVSPAHVFGRADDQGLVGESPEVWLLRDRIAFAASRNAHVLITGESGSGKELVSQAVHALSARSKRALISRNAATFPPGLIDAELFGNVKNYPNAGMPERQGLIGEADGGTLFLDEIGELPLELQTHLLRVLDSKGEYQKLGDSGRRTADVRVIGATNRPVDQLRSDFAARLALRLELPGLNDRREDIPLIARHLLLATAARDPGIGSRFFDKWDGHTGVPRVSLRLIESLVNHFYGTHVRELGGLLWTALSTSPGDTIEATDAFARALRPSNPPPPTPVKAEEITAEQIIACLKKHNGVRERVWPELGLANRYVLKRLIKKHGIVFAQGDDSED